MYRRSWALVAHPLSLRSPVSGMARCLSVYPFSLSFVWIRSFDHGFESRIGSGSKYLKPQHLEVALFWHLLHGHEF